MAEALTTVAVDCDPKCEYKRVVADLVQRQAEELSISTYETTFAFYGSKVAKLVGLPTRVELRNSVNHRYQGTLAAHTMGKVCTQACSIERFAAQYDDFGTVTEVSLNALRTEN